MPSSLTTYLAAIGRTEQAEKAFKRMDTNGDKTLSLEEFKAGQKPPVKPAKKAAGKKFQRKAVEKQ